MATKKRDTTPELDEHVRRYAAGPKAYWRWVFGPDSPVWLPPTGTLMAQRVSVHPARASISPPSPFSTSLCAEFHGLERRALDAIFALSALQQCTIRDGRDLLLSGCHFRYNWEEFLKMASCGDGNLVLPQLKDGFRETDRVVAAEALWELFRAGTCAVLCPPDVTFPCGTRWSLDRHYLMGIVNVTPDSFSDGGRFMDADVALAHAVGLVLDGADALDLGAESSRPGARSIPAKSQKARLLPVLKRLRKERMLRRIPISIDTQSAEVLCACLEEGADLLNDISAMRRDRRMARAVSGAGCPVILMHMLGTPRTMQRKPGYGDVVDEILLFFRERMEVATSVGIRSTRLLLDPGIGFGKTLEHNCTLLRRLDEFRALGRPVLVGASRKSFLGKLSGEENPARRVDASVTAGVLAVRNGAAILRVHDVAAHARALAVAGALV